MRNSILADLRSVGDQFCIKCSRPFAQCRGRSWSMMAELRGWWTRQSLLQKSRGGWAWPSWRHEQLSRQWRIKGLGSEGCGLSLSDLTFVLVFNSCIDRIVYHFLTDWLFWIKRAFHFATKVNSRDIPKCICFFSALVPSIVVKHDSLWNLAEELQFWQQDLPTPFSLLSELKERQFLWKQYTPTLQLPGNLIG